MVRIDLNSDLGEVWRGTPMADDAAMFSLVTSANVACGFHAGDATSMLTAVRRASASGVALGAHPSYRDESGFGRREQDPPAAVLQADVLEQLEALQSAVDADVADGPGVPTAERPRGIAYVKPHGALYNRIVHDRAQASAVVRAVVGFGERHGHTVPVLGLAGTVIEEEALAAGLPFVSEAFVDRAYRADGTLVPRGDSGAVITDHSIAVERAVAMVVDHRVTAIDGSPLLLVPASLCVHGDTPGSVELARAVRAALLAAGVELVAPW